MNLVELTEAIIKRLVADPETVSVKEFDTEEENTVQIEVLIQEDDMGRVIGKNGKVVRHKGQRLEAHHIKPLSLGGENIGANITPMEYKDHNDHRGIHSNEGSYKKLQDYAKEMNQC